ncbi:MAG TPA: S41 family peptidase, partial [Candidatus Nitrosotenuis sp.]|nr:S41 family peptidase [Candidatus Nitrosotenuis sp.]
PPQRVAKILFGFDAQAFGNEIRIFEVTKDGAAKAAGLQLGDRILAINGVHITRQNFDQLMLVMRRLLPTVQLDLMIQRGSEAPRRIQYAAKVKPGPVVRDWREDETIWNLIREAQTNEIKAKYLKGDDGIGYVFLPDFVRLPIEMRELMGELSGSRAVIVDLRRNPGGNVDTVAEFIGYFQKEPLPIVDLKERKKSTTLRVKPQRLQFTGPLFVLVDSRSSSGSEVFARHMQLQKRGVVVGDGTPGRLTAARFHQEELAGGTIFFGLQIAGARVVFPNGEEVEKIGVKPDILCLPRENDLRTENDYCRAIAYAEARKVLNLESESSAKTETKPN